MSKDNTLEQIARQQQRVQCPECERVFDLMDEDDANEWFYGHDCEPDEQEPEPAEPYDRPPRVSFTTDHRGCNTTRCLDCGLMLILFDDDEHFCEVTQTSTEFWINGYDEDDD